MNPARFVTAALLSCLALTPAVAQSAQDRGNTTNQDRQRAERRQARFRGMDTNRDGVVTRQEWRGNARSFSRLDENRDGVLSENEVWTGQDADWEDRSDPDGVLAQTFRRTDTNRDGIVSRNEWPSDTATFNRVDVNDDGVLTEPEFLGEGWGAQTEQGLTEREAALSERFRREDTNRDDVISRREWEGSEATFNRRDVNSDGVLSRREFMGGDREGIVGTSGRRDSKAYQGGYDFGLSDGRQAGREDRELRNHWDLEGQRELEQADAGYDAALGSREDYQAGYRAGFRAGYRQGFGRREP